MPLRELAKGQSAVCTAVSSSLSFLCTHMCLPAPSFSGEPRSPIRLSGRRPGSGPVALGTLLMVYTAPHPSPRLPSALRESFDVSKSDVRRGPHPHLLVGAIKVFAFSNQLVHLTSSGNRGRYQHSGSIQSRVGEKGAGAGSSGEGATTASLASWGLSCGCTGHISGSSCPASGLFTAF